MINLKFILVIVSLVCRMLMRKTWRMSNINGTINNGIINNEGDIPYQNNF